jgi:hypothetical protein
MGTESNWQLTGWPTGQLGRLYIRLEYVSAVMSG